MAGLRGMTDDEAVRLARVQRRLGNLGVGLQLSIFPHGECDALSLQVVNAPNYFEPTNGFETRLTMGELVVDLEQFADALERGL